MSPPKRKFDALMEYLSTEDEYQEEVTVSALSKGIVFSQTKRRRIKLRPFPLLVQNPVDRKANMSTSPIVVGMEDLKFASSLTKEDYIVPGSTTSVMLNRKTNGRAKNAIIEDQSDSSKPANSLHSDQTSSHIPTLCLEVEKQLFVLVKPSFAKGGFAHCSIWLGLSDRKMYVRKLQVSSKKPKDISHHFAHPNVPALVASINHGQDPALCDDEGRLSNEAYDPAEMKQRYLTPVESWSTMHEYVHGATLLDLFKAARATSYRFPEPAIWQCGATLLDIVQQMLFPGNADEDHFEATWHNDIYPRNVLVSNTGSEDESTNFHLIDFGIASKGQENTETPTDLLCISSILYSLILGRNLGCAARSEVLKSCNEYGWPYSKNLSLWVEQVYLVGLASNRRTLSSHEQVENITNAFKLHIRTSTKAVKAAGTESKIRLNIPALSARPWTLEEEDDAKRQTEGILTNEFGCFPCQKAIVDSKSLEIISVQQEILWK